MAKFFGSLQFAKNGDRMSIPDSLQTNGTVSYESGYGENYQKDLTKDPEARNIERKAFNQILFEITEALGVLQRQGMWEWRSDVDYTRGMQVLYNNDAWLCQNSNRASTPVEGNANWLRMVELFQQVGVSNMYQVGNGTELTAPIKGSSVFVTGYWKTTQQRIDRSASISVTVNGANKSMSKTGNRGGSKGHSYDSNFYFAFSHIFPVTYGKGDKISIAVSASQLAEYELFLTFLG